MIKFNNWITEVKLNSSIFSPDFLYSEGSDYE